MKHIITISEMALNKLGTILKEHNKSAIRFSVKGGGCNGFYGSSSISLDVASV